MAYFWKDLLTTAHCRHCPKRNLKVNMIRKLGWGYYCNESEYEMRWQINQI
jgi:hypothetical protein